MKFGLDNRASGGVRRVTRSNAAERASCDKPIGGLGLAATARCGVGAAFSDAMRGSCAPRHLFRPLCAGGGIGARCFCRKPKNSAYTLIEVLAALLLLAIVIPVAIEALHTASMAGEVAARKGEAARVADNVLNQNVITTNWNFGVQSGMINDGGRQFAWTLNSQSWPVDSAMELLTAQVSFSIQGHDYAVQSSTLVPSTLLNATLNLRQ